MLITKESNNTLIFDDIKSKICCLRLSFIASMIGAAVICGSIVFTRVNQLELDLAEQAFHSVAASAIKGAQAITRRKIQGSEIMATTISYTFPNASLWPFSALTGYTDISGTVNDLSSSPISFGVIVKPDQAAEFESFAYKVYREQNYPEGAGLSKFGFGIWKIDPASPYSDMRVHDISGNTSYGGKRSILVPVLQHTNITARSLMYNGYSENKTGPAQDSLIDCTKNAIDTGTKPNCITLTAFLELKSRPGPAAILLQSVAPINDPGTVIGFTSTAIVWEDVLNDVVPDYVNGLYCVISNEMESYTYVIEDGKPKLLGKGDLHDTFYDRYKIIAIISAVDGISTTASTYTLTVYPSDELFDTKSPWSLTIGFVMVIVTCTSIFFLYDLLMRNEARQRKIIIEMKRRFVRFVSHEIRTPLNTVCLGLELLQADLPMATNTVAGQQISETAHFAHCTSLVDDILENANNAVGILNDLLNYDKMEQGTFKLEIGAVPIWDVISRTVSSFDIQAKKRSIELTTTIDQRPENMESSDDLFRLRVLGDDVRLRQIIRNIISNSLKFSPENTGKIHVLLSHNPDGLPNAATPREDIVNEATSNTLGCTYPRAGSIIVIVNDNGVGMTEEQLNQMFQEGVQFEPNKLQNGGGSGLGLHITKDLVEKHGGTIKMLSEGLNKGCATVIELPLYMYPKKVRSLSCHSNDSITGAARNKASERIGHHCLVVDDSLPNRKMLARLLERSGHKCTVACHGQEAIDIVEADHAASLNDVTHVVIDTILMDYEMPILNGPDATKILREKGYKMVVFGVTGNVLADDVHHFISMGANNVLSKPVSMAAIEECWEGVQLNSYDIEMCT